MLAVLWWENQDIRRSFSIQVQSTKLAASISVFNINKRNSTCDGRRNWKVSWTSAMFDWSYQGWKSEPPVTREARCDLTWPVSPGRRDEDCVLCHGAVTEPWTPKYLKITNTVISHSPSPSTPSTPALSVTYITLCWSVTTHFIVQAWKT